MALMPVADALKAMLDGVAPLPEEQVALFDAFHRTLSRDLAARRTQPPAAMSAMDGYAVRASDATQGARLTVIGEAAAGGPFEGTVGAGEAVRIFTGGVVPHGADAVVIQEDVAREHNTVTVGEAAIPGRHIRRTGIDFHEGDVLLRRGRVLNDRDLSLAAAMNHPILPVHRKPKVAILATGDELLMPGSTPRPGQIIASNVYAVRALAQHEGAETIDLGIARDDVADIANAVRKAREIGADILVTTGGASVGDHDVVNDALRSEGVDMVFWKIALRPGKPIMHGRSGAMRVLGTPGNPTSSYMGTFLFLVPLIRAMSGRTDVHHAVEKAVLGSDLRENDHRQEYLRATLTTNAEGLAVATPVALQDSSLLGSLSAAQALIVREPGAAAAAAGETCAILRLPV